MSRSSAALAYDPTHTAARQTVEGTGSHARLLGASQPVGTRQRGAYAPAAALEPEHVAQLRLLTAPHSQEQAAPQKRLAHPVWLLATAGLAFLLLFTALRGATRGHDGRLNNGLSLAGYTEAATAASGGDVPVIDTTSQAQQADLASAAPAPASNGYDITGGPTISVQQIEAVLQKYGSPAAGKGQALYDLGLKYGINPAYGLAFFVHESACGTRGVARFTKSLGNIRWTQGYDSFEGYRSYPSWEAGMEDWYKLITDLYINGWGLRTVDAIIPRYAPYGDSNDPPTYISAIKSMVDSWRGK